MISVAVVLITSSRLSVPATTWRQHNDHQATFVQKLPDSTVEFKMVRVPGGEVKIGDMSVRVEPFYIGATEVTWDVFDGFILSGEPSKPYEQTVFDADTIARPSRPYKLPDLGWGHAGYPVINVHETTVEMFIRWLNKTTGKKYRLPSEAEWQLAASAPRDGKLVDHEWYAANSGAMSHPVGKKVPNKLGLHDMLGNVGEWCADLAGKRVLCGGDMDFEAKDLTPLVRRYYSPDWQVTDPQIPKSRWWLADGWFVGFRLACDP